MAAEDQVPEDERIPVDLDDETITDPTDEPEAAETDEEPADDDADADAEPLAAEPRAPSRGDRRIQSLTERNRALAEENARTTRLLDELRRSSAAPPTPVETPSQRAERLALLSPEERIRTEVDERLAQHERNQQALNTQLLDASDRAQFQAKVAANPLAKKLEPDVERRLGDLRARGQNLPREVVFTYLVGERALAQMGKGKPAAQANRARQQARPANTRGDVRPERGRRTGDVSDLERRFGDVQI